jgi:hypothetical protein
MLQPTRFRRTKVAGRAESCENLLSAPTGWITKVWLDFVSLIDCSSDFFVAERSLFETIEFRLRISVSRGFATYETVASTVARRSFAGGVLAVGAAALVPFLPASVGHEKQQKYPKSTT